MKRAITLALLATTLFLPLSASAEQSIVPNGISRIGAENTTDTPLDFSAVGVAVIDTGIDLSNPDLNVVGGIDCSSANGYSAGSVIVPGAQRSIWAELPEVTPATETAAPSTSGPPYQAAAVKAAAPETEDAPVSFYGKQFKIQVTENPANLGGKRVGVSGYDDGNGHGTHVAGIIGAKDNDWDAVGVAPNASLYSVRVLDASGSGSLENVICGLDWVTANADKISVANMSLGMDSGQIVMDLIEECGVPAADPAYISQSGKMKDEFHEAICRATDAGVLIVVAAGNGWGDARTVIPAAYPEVVTVSSFADFDGLPGGLADADAGNCPRFGSVEDDQLFSHLNGASTMGFGSYAGPKIDLAAPGVCVLSTFPQAGLARLTGTSMASPHVAGAAARLFADGRFETPAAVRTQLFRNAEKQTDGFGDTDQWHEPLVHVAS